MPTNRRPLRHAVRPQVSPEAIALFRQLEAVPKRARNTREYHDGEKRLCRILGLDFWSMKTPLSVSAMPEHREGSCQRECWRAAWEWRCALLEAATARAALPS